MYSYYEYPWFLLICRLISSVFSFQYVLPLRCPSIKLKDNHLRFLVLIQRLLAFLTANVMQRVQEWELETICMSLPQMQKLKMLCIKQLSNKNRIFVSFSLLCHEKQIHKFFFHLVIKIVFQYPQHILNFLICQGCNIEFSRATPGTPASITIQSYVN